MCGGPNSDEGADTLVLYFYYIGPGGGGVGNGDGLNRGLMMEAVGFIR